MKGVGAKTRSVSQSRGPSSVSQSRGPSIVSSLRKKPSVGKKGRSVRVSRQPEKPIKLHITIYKSDLSPFENALFMFYEAFHDLIYDTRGNSSDIKIVRTYLEPILQRQAEILSGIDFDFSLRPDLNVKMNQIHKEILIRLSQGKYANFEKLLLMRIIDFCGEAGNSNLEIKPISAFQTAQLNFVFHDAGYEDQYMSQVTTVNSSFCKIDKWTQHPKQTEIDKENKDLITNFIGLTGLQFNGVNYREGTNLRFTFHYFNFNGGQPEIKALEISVTITEFRDGTPVFEFKMSYDKEGILSPFPEENIRKNCYSVADAKAHIASIFTKAPPGHGCVSGLTLCPEIIKVMAMKAMGDKVTFTEAKIMGTTDTGAQAGAITHDRLSMAYLVRDIDERLRKNRDYGIKANLILPMYREDIGIGTRRGITFYNKRLVILNPPRANGTFNLTRRDIAAEYAREQLAAEERAYNMGLNNGLSIANLSNRERQSVLKSIKKYRQERDVSQSSRRKSIGSVKMGRASRRRQPLTTISEGVEGLKTKKKKPRKKGQMKKKQRTLRKNLSKNND